MNSGEKVGNTLYKLTEFARKDSAKLLRDIIQGFIKTKDISLSSISRRSGKINKLLKQKDIVSSYSKILTNTKLIMEFMGKYIHKITKILGEGGKTVYIAVDGGDIKKKYSKSKNISKTRDGSTGEIVNGYALETMIAFNRKLEVLPLMGKLFNRKEGYKSDNNVYFNLIEFVQKHISNILHICYIFDKGYDNWKLFEYISKLKQKFVVAMRNNRYVKVKGKTVWIGNATERLRGTRGEVDVRTKGGKIIRGRLYYGMVKMPNNVRRNYYMVVLKNNKGKQMFLTNKKTTSKEKALEILEIYNNRWLVEETYKYIKQEYNLEKINLRNSMERMNNYYNILLASIGISMIGITELGEDMKEIIIKERSKEYAEYKVKNIMYAGLELMEYVFENLKLYQNRYRRKRHLYQQNGLF